MIPTYLNHYTGYLWAAELYSNVSSSCTHYRDF